MVSNFPIDLFHDHSKIPSAPTFGVKLGYDMRRNAIAGPVQLFTAIFDSARHRLDYDFISKNPDYRRLVTCIPVDGVNWLDFHMSDQDQLKLFRAGTLAAAQFLHDFDWPAYKRIRARLLTPAGASKPSVEVDQAA